MEVKPACELQCRAVGLGIRFSQVTAYGLLLLFVTNRNMLVLRSLPMFIVMLRMSW